MMYLIFDILFMSFTDGETWGKYPRWLRVLISLIINIVFAVVIISSGMIAILMYDVSLPKRIVCGLFAIMVLVYYVYLLKNRRAR